MVLGGDETQPRELAVHCVFPRSSSVGMTTCCPQVEFPSLGRKILPEAVMLFFAHDLESGLFVQVSCRMKNALRPKRDFAIPCLPCESDAFFNQPLADAQATRLRF